MKFRAKYDILNNNTLEIEGNNMGEQKDFAVIGNLRISESVIATIAAIAVAEIDGVTLSPSFSTSDFRELIGHARLRRGVKVSFAEDGLYLDMQVQVRYGMSVTDVAKQVQENVINAIESMTTLNVCSVNVNIVGVVAGSKKE